MFESFWNCDYFDRMNSTIADLTFQKYYDKINRFLNSFSKAFIVYSTIPCSILFYFLAFRVTACWCRWWTTLDWFWLFSLAGAVVFWGCDSRPVGVVYRVAIVGCKFPGCSTNLSRSLAIFTTHWFPGLCARVWNPVSFSPIFRFLEFD